MRAMGDAVRETNERNAAYYASKWRDPDALMQKTNGSRFNGGGEAPAGAADIYPQFVAVQGLSGAVYWIEGGQRHPVQGSLSFPVVRLSQIDLRRWPIGEPISAAVAERRWRGLEEPSGWFAGVAMLPDGTFYHLEGTTARPLVSAQALESWNLHLKPARVTTMTELMAGRTVGRPIIALPRLRQRL